MNEEVPSNAPNLHTARTNSESSAQLTIKMLDAQLAFKDSVIASKDAQIEYIEAATNVKNGVAKEFMQSLQHQITELQQELKHFRGGKEQ